VNRSWRLTLGSLAALALACLPAISAAADNRPHHPPHGAVIATAHAVHTGVNARAHAHHARAHHAHRARAAEIRSASAHTYDGRPLPLPATPLHHPARSHAMIPHTAVKLSRAQTRGGTPYALGQASLSLGLWTGVNRVPVGHDEVPANPAWGCLRGRSPPRGQPLCATLLPGPARIAATSCAPADRFRALAPASSSSDLLSTGVRDRDRAMAAFVMEFASPFTPDRAFEGRPAGSHLPSWRCFA